MKVLLDIKDNKAVFVMGLLQRLPYVKANTLSTLKEAVEQMQLVKKGQLTAREADDLFDEL